MKIRQVMAFAAVIGVLSVCLQTTPEVEVAIQRVLRACLAQGVPCAITTGAGMVEQRLNEGFRFVTVGFDGGISAGVTTALERGRAAAGR